MPEVTTSPSIVFDLGGVLVDWNPRYLHFTDATALRRELIRRGLLPGPA
jgi:phosphoglycolate phosphatase-like HAD superfamily hydrolase